jgi:arylsulfatase
LKWDGADIGPLLMGKAADGKFATRSLYWVAPGWRSRAVRVGDWKLIVSGERPARKTELYNLAQDPRETTDLATKEPQRMMELFAALNRIAERDRDAVAKD